MERKKNVNQTPSLAVFSVLFLPLITLAATPTNFKDVITIVVGILNSILPVIVLLSLIYFFWGLAQYMKSDKETSSESKTIMLNGIIALFIMVSVWGFVWILTTTFIPAEGIKTPTSFSTTTNWSGTDTLTPNP